jgi:competence transcription factor ComK
MYTYLSRFLRRHRITTVAFFPPLFSPFFGLFVFPTVSTVVLIPTCKKLKDIHRKTAEKKVYCETPRRGSLFLPFFVPF